MVENLQVPIEIATKLRENGINTEIYLNDKKLKTKMKYADKLKIPYVMVVGEDEIQSNVFKIKNMENGTEKTVKMEDDWSMLF